jgi:hypothetical protein
LILLAALVTGCASSHQPVEMSYGQSQERKLTAAVQLLEAGYPGEAANVLAAICEEPGVPGVTDEALFRLALLRLGETAGGPHSALRPRNVCKGIPSALSSQTAPLLDLSRSAPAVASSNLLVANSDLMARPRSAGCQSRPAVPQPLNQEIED